MTAAQNLEPTLAIMQINDSLFPSGAFVQSYGLEDVARDGSVSTPEEMEAFISAVLHKKLATADGPAAFKANLATAAGDIDALLAADRSLYRSEGDAELRAASLATGRRQLEEVAQYVEHEVLGRYAEQVHADRSLGTQPAVFGAICAALEVEPEVAVAALLLGNVNGMLQSAMRVLPVSHRDVQAALHRLRPDIASIACAIARGAPPQLRAFQPAPDTESVRNVAAS